MSKAYNIIEASNMINTEFKVVYKSGEDRVKNVYVGANGTILSMVNDGEMTVVKGYGDLINAKFYKIPKAITFKEAVESGKKVRITKKISFRTYPDEVLLKNDLNEYETGKYVSLAKMLGILYWCIPWGEINNIFKEKCWLIEED